jgi:ABC-type bacteriocin/lantibiotic exporter with double-glycine peptidase domain
MDFAEILGTFGSIVSLGAIFWHFSWVVALIFVLTCIVAFIFILWFANEMKKANKNNEE